MKIIKTQSLKNKNVCIMKSGSKPSSIKFPSYFKNPGFLKPRE